MSTPTITRRAAVAIILTTMTLGGIAGAMLAAGGEWKKPLKAAQSKTATHATESEVALASGAVARVALGAYAPGQPPSAAVRSAIFALDTESALINAALSHVERADVRGQMHAHIDRYIRAWDEISAFSRDERLTNLARRGSDTGRALRALIDSSHSESARAREQFVSTAAYLAEEIAQVATVSENAE